MNLTQSTHRPYHDERDFPLREAQTLVRGLMRPKPWLYWSDFLLHITLGWASFFLALGAPVPSIELVAAWVIASLAFYRAVIFIHELAHLKKGTFRLFRFLWNLVCGIPLLVPSFTYDGVHNDHHKRDVYGTADDGEYVPFTARGHIHMVLYVCLSFVLPFFFMLRFLLLAPLSYLFPPLRRPVWERASSLTIDMSYRRPTHAVRNDKHWRVQEFAAFVFAAAVTWGFASGWLPWKAAALWYAVTVLIFLLNSLRTLAAHAYRNPPGHSLSVAGQYLDSINVPGKAWVTPLWAPVGLRFHATHHLFPAMPYHNLSKAHRLLVARLSDNTLYLRTVRASLWDALWRIWREAAESRERKGRGQRELENGAKDGKAIRGAYDKILP